MNRGTARTFFSVPAPQANVVTVTSPTLNTEKNQLLSIMAKYLLKQANKETTVQSLTQLEVTLTSS
uniref:Uncharacterized protein n=1 Tax=viral metagenome TaxID=1070528 RepID=A0A6C0F3J0_9ZZZZ